MERQTVVVMVEEAEASRAALRWAVRNYIRYEDSITLLYVCPFVRSRKKRRNLRLKGFQLALSFKELCNGIAEDRSVLKLTDWSAVTDFVGQAKVEIVVTEGEQGDSVISTVNKLGATTLVLGLHDDSFLYRATYQYINRRNMRCRVLAVKQHPMVHDTPILNLELSQVETIQLSVPETKIPFPIFTIPLGAICGKSKRRKKEVHKRRKYVIL